MKFSHLTFSSRDLITFCYFLLNIFCSLKRKCNICFQHNVCILFNILVYTTRVCEYENKMYIWTISLKFVRKKYKIERNKIRIEKRRDFLSLVRFYLFNTFRVYIRKLRIYFFFFFYFYTIWVHFSNYIHEHMYNFLYICTNLLRVSCSTKFEKYSLFAKFLAFNIEICDFELSSTSYSE